MKESILAKITKCPDCGCAFIKENSEICNCPENPFDDSQETINPQDHIVEVNHGKPNAE